MNSGFPCIDPRRLLADGYAVHFWTDAIHATGGYLTAIKRGQVQFHIACLNPLERAFMLAALVEHRDEILDRVAIRNREFNVEPLPGLRPMAARSAATA